MSRKKAVSTRKQAPAERDAGRRSSYSRNVKKPNAGRSYAYRSKYSTPKRRGSSHVDRLLGQAERALKDYRLTTPSGDNAYEYYKTVLVLDPGNRKAKRGITRIADRYARLAQARLDKYEYKEAKHFVALGLKVQPDNENLLQLKRDARLRNAPKHLWKDIRGGAKDIKNDLKDLFRF